MPSDILFGSSFTALCSVAFSAGTDHPKTYTIVENPTRPEFQMMLPEKSASSVSSVKEETSPDSPLMLRAVLTRIAASCCEYCGQKAPFIGEDNIPFLMLHHIDPRKGNELTNCVVLCPVCNARIVNLKDSEMNTILMRKAAHHQLSDLFAESSD